MISKKLFISKRSYDHWLNIKKSLIINRGNIEKSLDYREVFELTRNHMIIKKSLNIGNSMTIGKLSDH